MDKIWNEMYQAAKAVQNDRKLSDYVEAGGVAAAVLSGSGNIYTGACRELMVQLMPETYRQIEIMLDYEAH